MDTKTILGYIFSFAGLVGLFFSAVPKIREKLSAFLPESFQRVAEGSMIVISLIFLGVGIFLLVLFARTKKESQKKKEVPIYKGKEIVGYRRKDD